MKIIRFYPVFFLVLLLICFQCSTEEELPQYEGEDLSFLVFSDVQQGYGVFGELAKIMAEIEPVPLACFCLGDIMLRSANEVEWVNFWRYARPVTDKMPFYLARGYHDGNDDASELILRQQYDFPDSNFYYNIFAGNIHFIILDVNIKGQEARISGEQLKWLTNQLEASASNPFVEYIFVLMHHPPYPQGLHKGENLGNADELHHLFMQHPKIRTVFAGHDHLFNHNIKDSVHYITTGGGGGVLYHGYGGDYHHFLKVSVFEDGHRINIKSIGIFCEVVEDFDI